MCHEAEPQLSFLLSKPPTLRWDRNRNWMSRATRECLGAHTWGAYITERNLYSLSVSWRIGEAVDLEEGKAFIGLDILSQALYL